MTVFLNYMDISSVWCMLKINTSPSFGRGIGIVKVLGCMNQVNLKLRKVGIEQKNPMEVTILLRALAVLLVGRDTWVGILPVWMVSFRL